MRKEEEFSDNKSSKSGESCKDKDRVSFRKKLVGDTSTTKLPTALPRPSASNVHAQQGWILGAELKNDGKIGAKELQHAFKVYQGKHFSDNVCKFVVRLFDLDKNGGLDVREFEQLFYCIKEWITAFNACDRNRSGYLTEAELDLALKSMNVNFNPEFVAFLINRCDPFNKKMSLGQFIITCVQMQKFGEEFKARDEKSDGVIKLRYEEFLELLMKSV